MNQLMNDIMLVTVGTLLSIAWYLWFVRWRKEKHEREQHQDQD